MNDQRTLILHLKKYRSNGFNRFLYRFLNGDIERYRKTFTKNGNFKMINDRLFAKNGERYGRHVATISVNQLAKELGL
jgi:hypothetical protein